MADFTTTLIGAGAGFIGGLLAEPIKIAIKGLMDHGVVKKQVLDNLAHLFVDVQIMEERGRLDHAEALQRWRELSADPYRYQYEKHSDLFWSMKGAGGIKNAFDVIIPAIGTESELSAEERLRAAKRFLSSVRSLVTREIINVKQFRRLAHRATGRPFTGMPPI